MDMTGGTLERLVAGRAISVETEDTESPSALAAAAAKAAYEANPAKPVVDRFRFTPRVKKPEPKEPPVRPLTPLGLLMYT